MARQPDGGEELRRRFPGESSSPTSGSLGSEGSGRGKGAAAGIEGFRLRVGMGLIRVNAVGVAIRCAVKKSEEVL
jgi:hypothetical protein